MDAARRHANRRLVERQHSTPSLGRDGTDAVAAADATGSPATRELGAGAAQVAVSSNRLNGFAGMGTGLAARQHLDSATGAAAARAGAAAAGT